VSDTTAHDFKKDFIHREYFQYHNNPVIYVGFLDGPCVMITIDNTGVFSCQFISSIN
jgi:hypothetical protein